jgi:hypothetical protein
MPADEHDSSDFIQGGKREVIAGTKVEELPAAKEPSEGGVRVPRRGQQR